MHIISSGYQILTLFQNFLLAGFRLMYIIQPAACTAEEKNHNDMLIGHPHQDYLILSVMFLFLLVTLFFFWVLQNVVLRFCLTMSLKLDGKVKLPVWEILCDGCRSGFFIYVFLTASMRPYMLHSLATVTTGVTFENPSLMNTYVQAVLLKYTDFLKLRTMKPLHLVFSKLSFNDYELQSGLDKSGFEVRSLKCQEDNCVHACSELLDYLAKVWIIILLLLLLTWVVKIRSASRGPTSF